MHLHEFSNGFRRQSGGGVLYKVHLRLGQMYSTSEEKSCKSLWIKDLSVARHQAWRSAGKVVMLRCHEIIPDQHRHRDWPKGTLHASYAHVAYMDTERF